MSEKLPSIGFVGLGIMGLPMARHLCEGGYPVTVYNRTKSKVEAAKRFGAHEAASPRALSEQSDVIITMLTDPAAVRAVVDGADGVFSSPRKGQVWIQMSTIDIASTLSFAKEASSYGMTFVDCPVTGSKKQVEAAELILLCGAEESALECIRPILLRMGKTIIDTGRIGGGTALKLCMNLIVAQMTTSLAEAVVLAESTKVDPALIFEALRAAPALNCGYFEIKKTSLLTKKFEPAFSLGNMTKDVGFMVREAQSRGVELPITGAVLKLLQKARGKGLQDQDVSSVYLAVTKPSGA